MLQASAVCVSSLTYELITTPAGRPATGTVTRLRPVQAATAAPVRCPSPAAQDEEVTVAFHLSSIPAAATLVVADGRAGPAIAPTAIPVTTVHRFVPLSQYLWVPIISGAALAAGLLAVIWALALAHAARSRPDKNRPSFWRKPIYASAAWTFKDSWATNIGFGATAVAATLTGAGAVSTLLPGVQLDRYAILMSLCGAIIVAAPLVFGILYAVLSRSNGMVPDNATLMFPPDETGVRRCEIQVAGGASVTLPAPAAGADTPILVPPGQNIVIEDVMAVLPGDSTIVLMGISNNGLRVHAPDAAGGTVAAHASARPLADADRHGSQRPDANGTPGVEITPPAGYQDQPVPFATIKVKGFATMMLPPGTTARAPEPDGKVMKFAPRTVLRIPLGDNVMVADFRSLLPAALVTMFGIGAQLGTLGVLAFALSNRTGTVRYGALALIIFMALTVLAYAIVTTLALSDSKPGSAMTADSATSATL